MAVRPVQMDLGVARGSFTPSRKSNPSQNACVQRLKRQESHSTRWQRKMLTTAMTASTNQQTQAPAEDPAVPLPVLGINTSLPSFFQASGTELGSLGTDAMDEIDLGGGKWLSNDLKRERTPDQRTQQLPRKTKIVCTIGPSSCSREDLFALADAGMNVARLNMSHGDHTSHQQVIDLVKEYNASGRRGDHIGILLDTKGPEVRSGDVGASGGVVLSKGDKFTFTVDYSVLLDATIDRRTTVNYDDFVKDVHVNDILLVDGGIMSMRVESITGKDVNCEVVDGGTLTSRRHLNVQGRTANLPSITEQDWKDLKFGIEQEVDFFALSFVNDARVILEVKEFLRVHNAEIAVLPKIESVSAVRNLDEILLVSDGAMVARGDLGAELPVEEVPLIQSEIVFKCQQQGKPVIVATNMLESMITNPTPTRAEVADITVAVREGADAVMLSGETANGKYPIKALEVMSATAKRVPWELAPAPETPFGEIDTSGRFVGAAQVVAKLSVSNPELVTHLFAYNATNMSNVIEVPILLFTRSGFMAALISHFRPRKTVFAFTNNAAVQRRMSLYRGIMALRQEITSNKEETLNEALETLKSMGHIKSGDEICIIQAGLNTIWRKNDTKSIVFKTVA
mmetsp:Transcript_27374/g.37758  ORF Transcript_27374/g.37758 Transcript_27374/m.37758 type:complete len:626 (-) Transcript_27374:219-2096(-)